MTNSTTHQPQTPGEAALGINRDECVSAIRRIQENGQFSNTCPAHEAMCFSTVVLLRGRIADVDLSLARASHFHKTTGEIWKQVVIVTFRVLEITILGAIGAHLFL